MPVQSLPQMLRPPVTEVVCGAFFSPLPLDALSLGSYWGERKADFPKRKLLTAVIEGAEELLAEEVPPLRSWMISENDEYIVQIQNNRFYLNWRANSGKQRYPRFEDTSAGEGIISLLKKEYAAFVAFCEAEAKERPALLTADLAKINTITQPDHWTDLADLAKLIPSLEPSLTVLNTEAPELNVLLLDKREWSLLVRLQTARELEGAKRAFIRVEIRARAKIEHDTFGATFTELNNRVNEAFGKLIPRQQMIVRFGGKE